MPLEIIVGGRSVASSDITQHVEIRDDDDKFMRLLQVIVEDDESSWKRKIERNKITPTG